MIRFTATICLHSSVARTVEELEAAIAEGMQRMAVREYRLIHGPQTYPPASWIMMYEDITVVIDPTSTPA